MIKMTKRKKITGIILLIIIIAAGFLIGNPFSYYKLRLFRSDSGWGYEVVARGKPYIHQPYIPAVEGQTPFSSRHSARKTGRFVIKKLREHKSPSVSREEVRDILDEGTKRLRD